MFEFRLPDIGEGLTEAEIVSWMVAVGDAVKEDQAIVAIETDKAVVEMPAPATGVVVRLGGQPGDVVKVGEVLVVIDDGTDATAAPAATAPTAAAPAPSVPRAGRPLATPATRGLARRLGVALADVRGTGPGGRITDADVEAAAAGPAPAPAPASASATTAPTAARPAAPAPVAGQRIPLRGVRKRTAETMTAAWQSVPHINSFHEVDVTALFDLRRQLKPVAAARGVDLTLTAFLVKATGLALAEQPTMNASLDLAAGEIVLHADRNVAVAVDTDDGLVLPVIRHADTTPLLDIARGAQPHRRAGPGPAPRARRDGGQHVHRQQPRGLRRLVRHLARAGRRGRHPGLRPGDRPGARRRRRRGRPHGHGAQRRGRPPCGRRA